MRRNSRRSIGHLAREVKASEATMRRLIRQDLKKRSYRQMISKATAAQRLARSRTMLNRLKSSTLALISLSLMRKYSQFSQPIIPKITGFCQQGLPLCSQLPIRSFVVSILSLLWFGQPLPKSPLWFSSSLASRSMPNTT